MQSYVTDKQILLILCLYENHVCYCPLTIQFKLTFISLICSLKNVLQFHPPTVTATDQDWSVVHFAFILHGFG